jgi:hypothetical protein
MIPDYSEDSIDYRKQPNGFNNDADEMENSFTMDSARVSPRVFKATNSNDSAAAGESDVDD